jgi:hypothetical protein
MSYLSTRSGSGDVGVIFKSGGVMVFQGSQTTLLDRAKGSVDTNATV